VFAAFTLGAGRTAAQGARYSGPIRTGRPPISAVLAEGKKKKIALVDLVLARN
jgi:hypothetical protein